ncbi:DUF3800 domain-containing protein [Fibrobacter sp. UWH4]|uniref:DUF3800 domain-containing protein n=1 Tax=Fibrobacter sp. UWH4 TaxID=1896210 RepID=UPI0009232E97|nr:DUF3800 domain-containing protein [Fibrobacter sp. UWH4]SHL26321.1 hypothetical protein SAMN05720762_10574 [Fibrobacter sp. UWH4]
MSIEEFVKLREAEAAIHRVKPCNEKWEFYYDETGNCRKFRLKEGGNFNNREALSHYFILGGLVFDSKDDALNCNPQALISSLGLQANVAELKSHHLCPTDWDFEHFIRQDKVTKIIRWICNSKANIQYSIENNLYFALVDIVDSLNKPEMGETLFSLKDALYRAANAHLDDFALFLSNYGFPDIVQTEDFWLDLTYTLDDIAREDNTFGDDSWFSILRNMVKDNARHPAQQENILITDNKKFELQDTYVPFYMRPCYTFLYAHHNFDEEKQIIPQMSGLALDNYCFVDSVNEPLIQISDCFVSILSKILFFFDSKTLNEIEEYSKNMDATSKQNFKTMYSLIVRADAKHKFLIHNVNAISVLADHEKKWNIVVS